MANTEDIIGYQTCPSCGRVVAVRKGGRFSSHKNQGGSICRNSFKRSIGLVDTGGSNE